MNYQAFVARVIADGEEAARRDYPEPAADLAQMPRLVQSAKRAGALAGFEACKHCDSPQALQVKLSQARRIRESVITAGVPAVDDYWRARCFELEIEWVCNVVSALLCNEGLRPLIEPTSRGIMKCAEILGARVIGVSTDPQWFGDSPSAGDPDCLCSFCGLPIGGDEPLVLRAVHPDRPMEVRSCGRDACRERFLSGVQSGQAEGRLIS